MQGISMMLPLFFYPASNPLDGGFKLTDADVLHYFHVTFGRLFHSDLTVADYGYQMHVK